MCTISKEKLNILGEKVQQGEMSINDARKEIGLPLNPIEGADHRITEIEQCSKTKGTRV